MTYSQVFIGDTLVNLNEVIVKSWRDNSQISTKEDASLRINADLLDKMPKIMGESNPLKILQSFSGVSTNNEMDASLHIEGSENCHNLLTINNVNVYGANHLLGFFSVFNPTHFMSFDLQKNAFRAAHNRIGASLNFIVDTNFIQPKKCSGDFSVSLLSFQSSVKYQFSNKLNCIASVRKSFINLVYKGLLTLDEMNLDYNFEDYNLSLYYTPKKNHSLIYNFYSGLDKLGLGKSMFDADVSMKWENFLSSLDYKYKKGSFTLNNQVYFTKYNSLITVYEVSHHGILKSKIDEFGDKLDFKIKTLSFGINYNGFDILPQNPMIDGNDNQIEQKFSNLINFWAEKKFFITQNFVSTIGAKYNLFISDNYTRQKFDYNLGLKYIIKKGFIKLDVGQINQFVYQTGFSNSGLPTEFWISSNQTIYEPQKALGANLCFNRNLYRNKFNFEASVFYKKLYNQLEYVGSFFDVLYSYNLEDYLMPADGYNVGANVMFIKNVGNFTGQISYSWQRLRRTSDRYTKNYVYPASYDRPHEINALLMYKPKSKWEFASTFVFCSGNPTTIANQIYLVNGCLICQYNDYNSDRLPAYLRLDLSATLNFKPKKYFDHGINFSVYNSTANTNVIFYSIKFYKYTDEFVYKPITFSIKVLPSISYFIKFGK